MGGTRRRAVALVASVGLLVGVFALANDQSLAETSPGAASASPGTDGDEIAAVLRFRSSFGLESEESAVRSIIEEFGDQPELKKYGTTLRPDEQTELDRRVRQMLSSSELLQHLEQTYPDRFGGGYTDQRRSATLVLQFVGAVPDGVADAVANLGLNDAVEYEIVDQTLADLTSAQALVSDLAVQNNTPESALVLASSVDVPGNRVAVAFPSADAMADARLGSALQLPGVEGAVVEGEVYSDESAPRGGDALDDSLPQCSVAFSANQWAVGPVVLTAAHCPNSNYVHMDPYFHFHGLPYAFENNGGSSDVQAHYPNGPVEGKVYSACCLRNVSGTTWAGGWWDAIGDIVCISGRAHRTCGQVTSVNATLYASTPTLTNMRCADYNSSGGDSGGAVWGPVLDGSVVAVGVHKGTYTGYGACGDNGKAYSFISNVMSAMGLTGIIYG